MIFAGKTIIKKQRSKMNICKKNCKCNLKHDREVNLLWPLCFVAFNDKRLNAQGRIIIN